MRKRSEKVFDPSLTQGDHYCGGIHLEDNTFEDNAGCVTTSHAVRVYCLVDSEFTSSGFVRYIASTDTQVRDTREVTDSEAESLLSINVHEYSQESVSVSYGGTEYLVDPRKLAI